MVYMRAPWVVSDCIWSVLLSALELGQYTANETNVTVTAATSVKRIMVDYYV